MTDHLPFSGYDSVFHTKLLFSFYLTKSGNEMQGGTEPPRYSPPIILFYEMLLGQLDYHTGKTQQSDQVGNCHETVEGIRNIPNQFQL